MCDVFHNEDLFGVNSQSYSLVDIINEDNSDDNSINILTYSPYYDNDKAVEILADDCKSLIILSLNCQSLNAKFNELQVYLEYFKESNVIIDVICLQETWLSDQCDISLLSLEHYNFISKPKQCSAHGGVAVYLHEKYNFRILDIFDSDMWDGHFMEVTGASRDSKNEKLVIGNIYRPPRQNVSDIDNFTEDMSSVFQSLQRFKNVIITGDFNVDLLKHKDNIHINKYLDNIVASSYVPKITFPTRLTHNHGTLIDNFFMKLNETVLECKTGILLNGISDHLPYFIKVPTSQHQKSFKTVRVNCNEPGADLLFQQYLAESNIELKLKIGAAGDPEENYKILNSIIKTGYDKYFRVKVVKFNRHRHKRSPWITYGIMKSIRYRDKLYKELKKILPQDVNFEMKLINFQTYRSILRKCIRNAKQNYYFSSFEKCKNDIKATWKNINHILNRFDNKSDFPNYFLVNGTQISDPVEIANQFNKYFTSIGPELANKIGLIEGKSYMDYLDIPVCSQFSFKPVKKDDIINIIGNLKTKTSRGIDLISNKMLKVIKNEISQSLAIIINQSFTHGIFPKPLKIAKIIPLFKKDQNFLFTNYRPVSILSSLSKVFEKAMFAQIYQYLIDHNLLFDSQYGFRTQHSTELATIELLDRLYHEVDEGESPISIFLDLSKAFDTIDHAILTHKLKYYGFDNKAVKLMQNYLTDRYQYVEFNDTKSELLNISTGVPQGSILGPLLFIIYSNDLYRINSFFRPIMYADDTTLSATLNSFNFPNNSNTGFNITSELEKFNIWLKVNKLSLNCKKTSAMIFHMPNKHVEYPEIKINEVPIAYVKEFNYLGIILNENLNWKAHIDYICKKLSKVVGILNKLKSTLPGYVLFTIYNSLFVPHLNYGALIWEREISRLTILQKKALRAVTNSTYNAHTSAIFKGLRILKCKDICALHCMKFCYKLENKLLPKYFLHSGIFLKRSEFHNHFSRRQNDYNIPRIKHEFARQSIRYKAAVTFNSMTTNFRVKIDTHSFIGFKHYIKRSMIDSYATDCHIENCYICNR